MTPVLILLLLGITMCVLGQGFFSGSEIAMVSANRLSLESKSKVGHGGAKLAIRLLEEEEALLGTCLIGTNLCVVTGTTLVTSLLMVIDINNALFSALVFAPVALIFGENLPKNVQAHADRLRNHLSAALRSGSLLASLVCRATVVDTTRVAHRFRTDHTGYTERPCTIARFGPR